MDADAYPIFSPLAALPLHHSGTAMHEGSWDRTGGNRDCVSLAPGQTITLLDHDGAGIIHRFWTTVSPQNPAALRQLILRMYWDNETNPSVECPLGDFFGVGFGLHTNYVSLPLFEDGGGYNCYWPMPFHQHARWTLENRSDEHISLFYYNIDYTAYDSLPQDMMEFHACWRRENPTDPHRNYTILEAEGDGIYAGVALFMQGINMGRDTWAYVEGDEMIYIDQPNPNPPSRNIGNISKPSRKSTAQARKIILTVAGHLAPALTRPLTADASSKIKAPAAFLPIAGISKTPFHFTKTSA